MTYLKEQSNVGISAPAISHPIRNLPPSIPSTVKQIKELQISRGKAIRASIEYVVCPSTLISFICLVPRAGRSERGCIYPADKPIDFSSGQWRNLWSPGLEFAEKRLKNFVDVIHTGIVEIWNLDNTNGVSSPHFPDFLVSHRESVFVKRPIQDTDVPRRQRSRGASSRCRVGVSHQ